MHEFGDIEGGFLTSLAWSNVFWASRSMAEEIWKEFIAKNSVKWGDCVLNGVMRSETVLGSDWGIMFCSGPLSCGFYFR